MKDNDIAVDIPPVYSKQACHFVQNRLHIEWLIDESGSWFAAGFGYGCCPDRVLSRNRGEVSWDWSLRQQSWNLLNNFRRK